MSKAGIYQILNTANNKSYVGQSINILERLSKHKSQLRNNKHTNSHLQNSWNKYGEEAFEFKILKVCKPRYLDRFEKLYIRVWDLQNPEKGYNKESGGKTNKEVSEETKRKMSKKKKGENNPLYGRTGEKSPIYGRKHTEEELKKMSEKRKEYWKNEENRKKMSGENHPHWGNPRPEETRRKTSKTHSERYNTTGFYRVSRQNSSSCKKGFYWFYQYYVNSQRKSISSTDLNKLKEKVLEQGLEWQIINEEKAKQSLKKNIGDKK